MSELYAILAVAFIGAFLSLVLKEIGFHGHRLFSTVVLVTLFLVSLEGVGEICRAFSSLSLAPVLNKYIKSILKTVGVGYIFGITSDVCREIGEGGIASALVMVGRVEILLICAPYISEIIGIATKLST